MAKRILKNLTKRELLELEREVIGFNITSIIGDQKLKIDHYGYNNITRLKELQEFDCNEKNILIAGVVKQNQYYRSNAGNEMYFIHLADDMAATKMYCNLQSFAKYAHILIEGEPVLFNVSSKNGFITFDKCMKIADIPFKKDTIFVIHMPFNKYSQDIEYLIKDSLGVDIKPGNVRVFQNTRDLGIAIEPTYELIGAIKHGYGINCSLTTEDAYLWPNSIKLIKEMEDNGF